MSRECGRIQIIRNKEEKQMTFFINILKVSFSAPGSSWVLGNVTPAGAMLALVVPLLIGFCLGYLIFYRKEK